MIKNVIFDIGNVLVDFRWREIMNKLVIDEAIQNEFEKSVFGSKWWHEFDHGTMEEEDIVRRLREDNQERIEAFELVWEHRDELVNPYPYAVSWIKELKEKGYQTYLLSNYPSTLFTMHTNNGSFPFLDEVDGKIISGFVKMIKPDADIYEKLMSEYQLKAEECVFIDDRKENVDAAIQLGMKGIIFENFEQANKKLGELLK